jgi:hypothetical protein
MLVINNVTYFSFRQNYYIYDFLNNKQKTVYVQYCIEIVPTYHL